VADVLAIQTNANQNHVTGSNVLADELTNIHMVGDQDHGMRSLDGQCPGDESGQGLRLQLGSAG
jgi:hypothetical protein